MHPSADRIIDLYERHAHDWDGERGKSLFERPWLDRFRDVAGPGGSVLDLGCGSAEPIARYFIDNGHTVTGIDASPSLIRLSRERFPGHTWLVGDMRHARLGASFGGILAWDSFFHLPAADQRAMFAVFRAHAHAGTALMFTSGPSAGEAIGSYRGEALYHASLDRGEYAALLGANGFQMVNHRVEDESCGGHTVWLAKAGC
jgi:SAM-dependent methyltransferase